MTHYSKSVQGGSLKPCVLLCDIKVSFFLESEFLYDKCALSIEKSFRDYSFDILRIYEKSTVRVAKRKHNILKHIRNIYMCI